MNAWVILSLAIVSEVVGTIFLKLSRGFENWWYAAPTYVCYAISFWLLAIALKKIELGVAYAVWAGAGTALVALVGLAIFDESMNVVKALSLGAIIFGVIGLHLSETANVVI